MDYQTFQTHPHLKSVIKCYWTLEVLAEESSQKQRIVPDGCIEMIFILGDDINRITPEGKLLLQPRAFVLGQITQPFYIEPTGYVNSFAVRFYPYGFANFVSIPIEGLTNKETPIEQLFGEKPSAVLKQKITGAIDTKERIKIVEKFFFNRLKNDGTIDKIVKSTVDSLLLTRGSTAINSILKDELHKRRQIERKFLNQVGMSPKQLSKAIRFQTALKLLLGNKTENLTSIAYESEYYDQAHFIKDFKEFTGITPKEFLEDESMLLSAIFYKND